MERTRKSYIDIIKIFATFMVIFNHSGDTGFLAYQNASNILVQILLMIPAILCKTAVPLFYMCTGALLLAKEEAIEKLWKKRVVKYVCITVGFTVLYYVFLSLRNHTPMDFAWILKTTYGSTTFSYSGAYWFLYSYIGFLIMLPLLRIIASNLNKELIGYIVLLNIFVRGFLPIAEICFGMEPLAIDMSLITMDVFFYPFIGYYIEQCSFEEICNKKNLLILFGMSVLAFVSSGLFTGFYLYRGTPTQAYLTLFGMCLVIFIFVFCKMNFAHKPVAKCVTKISACTFGVYLVHGIVFTIVDDVIAQLGITMTYGLAWIRCVVVFLISTCIVYVVKMVGKKKQIA